MRIPDSARLYPFDRLIVGYCFLMVALITVFGRPIGDYLDEILIYASIAVFALVVARWTREDSSRVQAALRLLYPLLLFTVFYRTTGGTMFLFFDRFYDSHLVAFEASIFGGDPSLYFDNHLLNTWANEIFSFCYFSYYFMLPVFLLVLFFKGRYETIRRSLAAICLTFFSSYLLFSLFPVEGPRWHFAGLYAHQIKGPVFRPLVDLVISNGAVRGGCMPSSHVAVALVILFYSLREFRGLGWALIPIDLGMAIGTVWGRFHYVSDVVVGAAISVVAYLVVRKFYDRWAGLTYKHKPAEERLVEHVA